MKNPVLDTYLADVDAAAARSLALLDAAIRKAHPDFDVAIKYRLLTYALHNDWRHWVCAINATRNDVCLRFLYGTLLDNPLGVLRAGTSTLMTWDFKRGEAIDAAAKQRGRPKGPR